MYRHGTCSKTGNCSGIKSLTSPGGSTLQWHADGDFSLSGHHALKCKKA